MKKFVNVFLLMLMVLPFTTNISFASEQEEKPRQREICDPINMDDVIALAGEDNILNTADDFYVMKTRECSSWTGLIHKGRATLQEDGSVLLHAENNEFGHQAIYKKNKHGEMRIFSGVDIGNLALSGRFDNGVSGEATATVTPQGIITYNISNYTGFENPNNNVFKLNVLESSLSVPGIDGVFGTNDDVTKFHDGYPAVIGPLAVLNDTTIGTRNIVGIKLDVPSYGIKYDREQSVSLYFIPPSPGPRLEGILLQNGGIVGGGFGSYEGRTYGTTESGENLSHEAGYYNLLGESLSDDRLGKIKASSVYEFANVDDASQLTDEQLIEKFGISAEYDGQEVPVEVTRTVANSSYSLITFHYNKPNAKTPQGIGSITTTLFNGDNEKIIPGTPKPEQPGNGNNGNQNNGNGTGQNTPNPNPSVENTTTTEQAKPEENKNTVNTGVNSVVSIGLLSVVVIASTLLFLVRKK